MYYMMWSNLYATTFFLLTLFDNLRDEQYIKLTYSNYLCFKLLVNLIKHSLCVINLTKHVDFINPL